MIPAVQKIQACVASIGTLFAYPAKSLHISLLGCTQREPARPSAHGPRIEAVTRAFHRATTDVGPTRVHLGGLNLIGTQLFIEVLTDEDVWRSLRERLATELQSSGENPKTHSDPEPMHLNIARILALTDPGELSQCVPEPGGVGQVDRDLGVLDATGGAGVLTLDPDR